jgi:hypothetical protein
VAGVAESVVALLRPLCRLGGCYVGIPSGVGAVAPVDTIQTIAAANGFAMIASPSHF